MVGLRNRSVLVTGSTGFIGSRLVTHLVEEGATVWTLARTRSNLIPAQVTQIECALEALTSEVWSDLSLPNFDVLFHLGGFTPKEGATANDLESCFTANILGTRQLLNSIRPIPNKVVFSSTLDVYAPHDPRGVLCEDSAVGPKTLYGSSKLFCEDFIQHWADGHRIDFVCLRYGHIYGPGEGAYKKLIPETIKGYLTGSPPTLYGDGAALRDLLYVDDAVEATIRASALEGNATLNIVSGHSVSVRSVVEEIARLIGVPARINFRPEETPGRSYKFDNKLMAKLLGVWPLTQLSTGLKREIDSMRPTF